MGDDVGRMNVSSCGGDILGVSTPNIDRIGAEGLRLTSFYAQPSCTAGRAAFITGQLPVRTGLTAVGEKRENVGDARRRLLARDYDRLVAGFQVRVAVLNGFTALGIAVTEAVGWVRRGRGEVRPSPDLCNRTRRNRSTLRRHGRSWSWCGTWVGLRLLFSYSI
jgi:hypothetical protein